MESNIDWHYWQYETGNYHIDTDNPYCPHCGKRLALAEVFYRHKGTYEEDYNSYEYGTFICTQCRKRFLGIGDYDSLHADERDIKIALLEKTVEKQEELITQLREAVRALSSRHYSNSTASKPSKPQEESELVKKYKYLM